jgi:hypothetical protein
MARCPHAPDVTVMVELEGVQGERLRRFSCGICVRGWWESEDSVIDLDEAVGRMRELAHSLHKRRTPSRATERQAVPRRGALGRARLNQEEFVTALARP